MDTSKLSLFLWLVVVFLFWLLLSVASGLTQYAVLLVLLAGASWWLLGTMTLGVLASVLLAWQYADFTSNDRLYAMYLPLYMMLGSAYLFIRLILFSPGVGDHVHWNGPGGGGA